MKARKYDYLYVLQGSYGFGWEDLTATDKADPKAYREIRANLREYRENEGGSYRIISRRELKAS